MSQPALPRTNTRRSARPNGVLLVVIAAGIIATLGSGSASSIGRRFSGAGPPDELSPVPPPTSSSAPSWAGLPRPDGGGRSVGVHGPVTEEDGALPDRVTAFDNRYPGVANLDADLLHALRGATTDAAEDGIDIYVNSGWRSATYQDQLFREAVSRYGSADEAARWVATADTSAHVSGDAVDIGEFDATAWLAHHGAAYGLCQIYRNESWHFELRPEAFDGGCPPMYADSAHDPGAQR